jgi:hypothetical protein
VLDVTVPDCASLHPGYRLRRYIAIAVMDKCLKAAGAGPEHVVKVQVFMTDITERPKINPNICRPRRWSR